MKEENVLRSHRRTRCRRFLSVAPSVWKPLIARVKCFEAEKGQPVVISDAFTSDGKGVQPQSRCSEPGHFLIATALVPACALSTIALAASNACMVASSPVMWAV